MNILMIGNKESGKTSYMASAFGRLHKGVSGFYIRTDESSQAWFSRLFTGIKQGRYPQATDKRDKYQFQLYHNQKKVLDFNWIDYNGGVITEKSTEKLADDIKDAEGMMVFLEAEALYKNKVSAHKFRRILALLGEHLINGEKPLFSVIIVLTKYDCIPGHVSIEQVIRPLQEFLSSAQGNDRLYVRVVPVSCTSKGFYNVELPLLDILDSGMKISYLTAIAQAEQYKKTSEQYNKKRSLRNWISSRRNGCRTNGEIANDYLDKCRKQIELFKSIEEPMKNLAKYVEDYKIRLPQESSVAKNSRSGGSQSRYIEL